MRSSGKMPDLVALPVKIQFLFGELSNLPVFLFGGVILRHNIFLLNFLILFAIPGISELTGVIPK
jgi:hypothetical protein